MKATNMTVNMDSEDRITVNLSVEGNDQVVSMLVLGDGSVMVCNNKEERIYHLQSTEYGGYVLTEGVLL